MNDLLAEAIAAHGGLDRFHYEGRFYHIVRSDIDPKPVQPGGPPLLFGVPLLSGVGSPAVLERAARLADGLNPTLHSWDTAEMLAHEFPEQVRRNGRDPSRMQTVIRVNGGIHAKPLPEPRLPLVGSLEQAHEDLQRLEQLGIRHVFYDLTPMPITEQRRRQPPNQHGMMQGGVIASQALCAEIRSPRVEQQNMMPSHD